MSQTAENVVPPAPSAEAAPPGRLLRFWRHPITQMLARIIVFVALMALFGYLLRLVIILPSLKDDPTMGLSETGATPWLREFRSLLPTVLAYLLVVRFLEKRPVSELGPRRLPLFLAGGWFTGMGIMVASALLLALFGFYRVQGFNADANLVTPLLVLGIGAGVGEEIVARGILFRVVEECFGTWAALVFSAALFGLGHIANPNATWWSSLAIAVEAGLLLGMAFAWTRSMWFVIALHAAWNFTQGPLLGIAVSGIAIKGLLASTLQGPPMLSGGEFGAEGSVLALAICVGLALWFTRRAQAAGRIVPPYWKRRGPDGLVAPVRFEPLAPAKPA
jgi:membrane protease YdiL (CAAX protease family)